MPTAQEAKTWIAEFCTTELGTGPECIIAIKHRDEFLKELFASFEDLDSGDNLWSYIEDSVEDVSGVGLGGWLNDMELPELINLMEDPDMEDIEGFDFSREGTDKVEDLRRSMVLHIIGWAIGGIRSGWERDFGVDPANVDVILD